MCCRCGVIYTVTSSGKHVRKEECNYHSGRVVRHKGKIFPPLMGFLSIFKAARAMSVEVCNFLNFNNKYTFSVYILHVKKSCLFFQVRLDVIINETGACMFAIELKAL